MAPTHRHEFDVERELARCDPAWVPALRHAFETGRLSEELREYLENGVFDEDAQRLFSELAARVRNRPPH